MFLYGLSEAKGGEIFRKDPGEAGPGAAGRGMGIRGPPGWSPNKSCAREKFLLNNSLIRPIL
jgi:hypothetical protein